MYLLDTNVISQFHKPQPDRGVLNWVGNQDEAELFISVVTVMEIEIGIKRLERRDPEQARRLQRWLDQSVLKGFEGRIVPIDLDAARRCAASHVPDPAPERDALIADTASSRGFTVVTRNEKDFRRFGVPVLNPFGAPDARR